MTIIGIVNQKGGVGKTTTAVNLAAALGALNRSTLLVDCDPQGNATAALGSAAPACGLYDVLIQDTPASHAVAHTLAPNLDLLPSTRELSGAEVELIEADDRLFRLRNSLSTIESWYEDVLLDCPPALGLLTVNALAAATSVLIPVQCEYLALEGLVRLMDTIERIRRTINLQLGILGIVLTMYDGRTMLSHQVAGEVRRHYPRLTFETVIPRNVRLSEAPSFGQSILDYDPSSRGARAYITLADEVVSRLPAASLT